jgi:putative transposase
LRCARFLMPNFGARIAHCQSLYVFRSPQFLRPGCLQDSRGFCQTFFTWYNEDHRHSGIALLTPAMLHYGQAPAILAQRQGVLLAAYQAHPERFVRRAPHPLMVPTEVWINKPENKGQ